MAEEGLDSENLGRLGMNIVERIVLLSFRWAFRDQTMMDAGIDAHVEVKDAGFGHTGRLLALQIKCGRSFFTKPSGEGWSFPFNDRLAKLWTGHALPVIVVLVDPDTSVAYWQQVTPQTVESTGKGNRIVVPRVNTVSTAADVWNHIASGIEREAQLRYDQLLTVLPPATVGVLERLHADRPEDGAVLAVHLADGRGQPEDTVKVLLSASPIWLTRAGGDGWRAVANYALAHDHPELASVAFERAAADQDGSQKGRLLVAAALPLLHEDRARAADLLTRAERLDGAQILVSLAKAILDHPHADASAWTLPPDLDLASDQVQQDGVVQAILAGHAVQAGDLNAAIRYGSTALELQPDDTAIMMMLADAYFRRSQSSRSEPDDLQRACAQLIRVVEQRHRWSGPTGEPLENLLRQLGVSEDYEAMLRHAVGPPFGEALPDEADRPVVRQHAVMAALTLGETTLAQRLADGLDESPRAQTLAARARGEEIAPGRLVDLWTQAFAAAESAGDAWRVVDAAMQLAELGVDVSGRLTQLVERSMITAIVQRRIHAIAEAEQHLDSAIPALRALTPTDPTAAEALISRLALAGRLDEALAACDLAQRTLRQPVFTAQRAYLLRQAGRMEEAESAARDALADPHLGPSDRRRLLTFLVERALDRRDGRDAERHVMAAIRTMTTPSRWLVWYLVHAQLMQLDPSRAATTLRHYRPQAERPTEGRAWLQAMAGETWDPLDAKQALAMATGFRNADPPLAAGLLTALVRNTRTEPHPQTEDTDAAELVAIDDLESGDPRSMVPDDLYVAAFGALNDLIDAHGPLLGLRRVDGSLDALAAELAESASARDHSQLAELVERVRAGRIPLGMLATMLGIPYGLALIQRASGVQVAASVADAEHDADVQAAAAALNTHVAVETSALMLLSQLSHGEELIGRFAGLHLPFDSRRDIILARIEARGEAAGAGRLGWDEHHGQPIFYPLTSTERLTMLRRANALDQISAHTLYEPVDALPDLRDADPAVFGPWAGPIQLARTNGWTLWSDDVAVRQFARALGVPAFGTPALIEALTVRSIEEVLASTGDQKRVDALLAWQHEAVRVFVAEFIVDVPATLGDVLAQAAADGWTARAGAAVLTRPSWWLWQEKPLANLLTIYEHVTQHEPDALPAWQMAAMEGLAALFLTDPQTAYVWITAIALLGFAAPPGTAAIEGGLSRATAIAHRRQLLSPPEPLTLAVDLLTEHGVVADPEAFLAEVHLELGPV
ncbi:DUF4365 domain-containing protein [Cryptosporangium arvum]|uniref:DUF4365 domain-containing protein n=1 Tax=Cryptosporangium arvum DSM 44712 TaxID=927661 RepID=A0A010Z3L9_9ACTN|nr:DUF4365 domain-containing protein [Cryptosporangium arvum]EXG81993.1 hypothetical protein CryarDRAFT_3121 [Cryptosporangium arvum DSM 44712]